MRSGKARALPLMISPTTGSVSARFLTLDTGTVRETGEGQRGMGEKRWIKN